jgi:hypothetical protein
MTAEQLRSFSRNVERTKKPLNLSGFRWIAYIDRLLDHLDYASRTRINQHRSIVYDRIAVIAHTVFRWNIVVGDACFGKDRAYSYIAFVAVRGPMFFDDIVTEARTCIYAENARHTADDPSDCAAYDSAYRTCGAVAFAGTAVDASFDALGGCG